ncbi:MAG TPA: type II secretion system F family protein [Desulfitobacteriaceae bacterium]|nr:type II secretion system F family protein [Desulfitobacteriaceae bacterium]
MKSLAYVWKAVDVKGQIRQGICEATEAASIRTWLREQGLFPLLIKPRREGLRFLLAGRNAKRQWAVFTRRLAIVLEAGIPLLKALDIISFQVSAGKNHLLQWQGVKEQIQRGSSIAEALQIVTPPPSLYILSMVKAGEKTGTIGNTLSEVADDLEQECLFQRKILAALTYPLFLSGAVICVTFALSLWILPTYEKLFASLGTQLPFLTVVIFACGRYLPTVLTLLILVGLGTLVFGRLFRPQSWQEIMTKFISYTPVFGRVIRLNELMQFCRVLGRLLSAGIPLLECLHFVEGTVRSRQMRQLTKEVTAGVCQGKTLARILQGSPFFPADACEMLNVAEETGKIDIMLQHLTIIFRQELDQQLARLTYLAEPVLILCLAGLIGLVAVGILLPVFDITTNLQ